jgi:hypothetical protein
MIFSNEIPAFNPTDHVAKSMEININIDGSEMNWKIPFTVGGISKNIGSKEVITKMNTGIKAVKILIEKAGIAVLSI